MSIPRDRMIAVALGLTAAPFAANELEQYRATTRPSGWSAGDAERLAPLKGAWRVMNSRWRILRGTEWAAKTPAQQMYLRAELSPESTLALSLQSTGADGTWFTVTSNTAVIATQSGIPVACMGSVTPPTQTAAVELQRTPDGILLRWGDDTMVCLEATPPPSGVPRIRIAGDDLEVQSIGRDRKRDGVPLAPIWWMAFVVGWMLPWILAFDFTMSLVRPKHAVDLPLEE